MRLFALSLLPLALASSYATQQPLQVYLHPAPKQNAHQPVPTLSADQAKAILTHHLGGTIGDFEEIPNDESLWGHLVNMWNGGDEAVSGKARVVFIDGGVSPQGRRVLHDFTSNVSRPVADAQMCSLLRCRNLHSTSPNRALLHHYLRPT